MRFPNFKLHRTTTKHFGAQNTQLFEHHRLWWNRTEFYVWF